MFQKQIHDGVAFGRLVGGHAAVGVDEAGHARGRDVVEEVLHPGVVGVARGRLTERPAGGFAQAVAAPTAHVERRIGQDVVGLPILVQVGMETVGGFQAEISFDAANCEVHPCEPPRGGIAFLSQGPGGLPPDLALGLGAVPVAVRVRFRKFNRLHEHAA